MFGPPGSNLPAIGAVSCRLPRSPPAAQKVASKLVDLLQHKSVRVGRESAGVRRECSCTSSTRKGVDHTRCCVQGITTPVSEHDLEELLAGSLPQDSDVGSYDLAKHYLKEVGLLCLPFHRRKGARGRSLACMRIHMHDDNHTGACMYAGGHDTVTGLRALGSAMGARMPLPHAWHAAYQHIRCADIVCTHCVVLTH